MKEEKVEPMNLYEKILKIMEEVPHIEKTGFNSFHKYNYVEANKVIEEMSKLFIKYKIVIIPSVEDSKREGELVYKRMTYTLVNVENPNDVIDIYFDGEGQDKGDKAHFKAYTGILKYFLMDTFLIPIGLDPENDGEDKGKKTTTSKSTSVKKQNTKKACKEAMELWQLLRGEREMKEGEILKEIKAKSKYLFGREVDTFKDLAPEEAVKLLEAFKE